MSYEVVYLGHNNIVGLQLLSDDVVYDLSDTTRMTLQFDTTVIDSDIHAGVFDWSPGDGKLYLDLGGQTIAEAVYYAELVVYSTSYIEGNVWGSFNIWVTS